MKVLLITNIPSPYRVDFFNEFGKFVDLTVVYEAKNLSDRNNKWTENIAHNFVEHYLCENIIDDNIKKGNKEITKYINRNYDFIIVSEYGNATCRIAINYLKKNKIPFILNADGCFIKEKEFLLKKLYKKKLIKSADYLITSGSFSANTLRYYGAKDNIFIYPFSSVREGQIGRKSDEERKALRQKLNINYERLIISVGRFDPLKGMKYVIEAASKVGNNIGVYLIGGEPTKEYMDLIERNNISNVHFVKHLLKDALAQYYECADLFVLMTYTDVWGLVVNEAFAKGVPVITTNKCIAGLEMIQNDINGYIINVEDSAALAEHINNIFADNNKLEAMSSSALEAAKKYTIEKMASRHLEILETFK